VNIYINDIAYELAENVLTDDELKSQAPDIDFEKLFAATGVRERRVTHAGETALDLGYKASLKVLPDETAKADISAIIFCTQHPDYIQPANACILHQLLELPTHVMAFDLSVGCSGYLYSLEVAKGLLANENYNKILIVTGNTMSKYVHVKDISSRHLIGDGATASVISRYACGLQVGDIDCATFGKGHDKIIIKAGACRHPKTGNATPEFKDRAGNIKTDAHFNMDGFAVLGFTTQKVAAHIKEYVKNQGLALDQVDQFIFHQASRKLLNGLAKVLKVDPAKVFCNIEEIGNTGASSVAIALCDALKNKTIQPGDKLILSAFGVGLSWATARIEFLPDGK